MAEIGRKLVLGFIGGDNVTRENALANIADLIAVYHRNNKGAEIVLYLACDPFTNTMSDLADYALTSGYKLGLVGTDADLAVGALKPFLADAVGRLHRVTGKDTISSVLVEVLNTYAKEARLILIADPNEDDDTYNAFVAAEARGIKTRSLLTGLDEVTMASDSDDPEPEEKPVPESVVEPEPEPDYDDPEDLSDLVEPDLSEDDGAMDPDEDIVDAELVEGDDALPGEDGNQEGSDESTQAAAEEPAVEPVKEEPVAEVTEAVPPAAPAPAKKVAKATKTAKKAAPANKVQDTPLNAKELTALATNDKAAFYEIAAKFDIYPGKGIKIPNMVNKILVATGGTPVAPVKAVAKKAPAKKVAAAKKAPAAKKVAPAKAAPQKAPAAKKAVGTTKAVGSASKVTTGTLKASGVSPKTVKAAAKLVAASTKLTEAALLLLSE